MPNNILKDMANFGQLKQTLNLNLIRRLNASTSRMFVGFDLSKTSHQINAETSPSLDPLINGKLDKPVAPIGGFESEGLSGLDSACSDLLASVGHGNRTEMIKKAPLD